MPLGQKLLSYREPDSTIAARDKNRSDQLRHPIFVKNQLLKKPICRLAGNETCASSNLFKLSLRLKRRSRPGPLESV
jgi:hypothetical protein